MKYVRYLMVMTVMLCLLGSSFGALKTSSMSGGVTSDTDGDGATYGYARSFVWDDDNPIDWLQADILALATATDKGSAHAKVDVPTFETKTLDGSNYMLSVGAQGVTEANAKGLSKMASVTSVARVHSNVDAGILDHAIEGTPFAVQIQGNAWISSAIGETWEAESDDMSDEEYQMGHIQGKPKGMFNADSSANGKATYYGKIDNSKIENLGNAWAEVVGSVEGQTTLTAKVADDRAEIKGIAGSIVTEPIQHFIPDVFDISLNDALQDILSDLEVGGELTERDDLPALAFIAAGSSSQIGGGPHDVDPIVVTGVLNGILVAAENDGISEDKLTLASGTVVGEAHSVAKSVYDADASDDGFQEEELKVSASKDDKLSADVNVFKALDVASAISILGTGAIATPHNVAAGSIADTFAGVNRENAAVPGETDGSDRVGASAFISEGTWESWGADLENGDLDDYAKISGNLIQEGYQMGMGAGSFLQYTKTNPAYANMLAIQLAGSMDGGLFGMGPAIGDVGTLQIVAADVMGPMAHSYGSSGWDGSGISANLKNLHVEAQDMNPDTIWSPKKITTDVADVDAYLWTDGTNNAQFNGMAFSVSDPVFNPSGIGGFSGLVDAYLPSATQRETLVGVATAQPNLFA